jgi:hypothetical protein
MRSLLQLGTEHVVIVDETWSPLQAGVDRVADELVGDVWPAAPPTRVAIVAGLAAVARAWLSDWRIPPARSWIASRRRELEGVEVGTAIVLLCGAPSWSVDLVDDAYRRGVLVLEGGCCSRRPLQEWTPPSRYRPGRQPATCRPPAHQSPVVQTRPPVYGAFTRLDLVEAAARVEAATSTMRADYDRLATELATEMRERLEALLTRSIVGQMDVEYTPGLAVGPGVAARAWIDSPSAPELGIRDQYGYGSPMSDDTCWRCDSSTSTSDVGLCAPCLGYLQSEREEAPPTARADAGALFGGFLSERAEGSEGVPPIGVDVPWGTPYVPYVLWDSLST